MKGEVLKEGENRIVVLISSINSCAGIELSE